MEEDVNAPAGFQSANVVLAGSLTPATSVSTGHSLKVPKPGELKRSVSLRTISKYGSLTWSMVGTSTSYGILASISARSFS